MFLQLDVTYQLRLRLYGSENHGAQVANESNSINITVLANNFPFGLFSFPHANYSVTVGTVQQYCLTLIQETRLVTSSVLTFVILLWLILQSY